MQKESLAQRLFPSLKDGKWKEVDLASVHANSEHKGCTIAASVDKQLSIIKASIGGLDDMMEYGGFGEERDAMWFGTGGPSVHFGVDFMGVSEGTRVDAVCDGVVRHVMRCTETFNGWGGRIIIETKHGFVLLGHLAHADLPQVDQEIKAGQQIGTVGNSKENGGWFPHIHVQLMSAEYIQQHFKSGGSWENIDGYGEMLPRGILDPMSL